VTNPKPTQGYTLTPDGVPFVLEAQAKRDNVYVVQFYDASNSQRADLSSATVTATVRETPYAASTTTSATLTASDAAEGQMTLTLADDAFDGLTWVKGEGRKCLWIDFSVAVSSFAYSARDGVGDYFFRLYLSQSILGQAES